VIQTVYGHLHAELGRPPSPKPTAQCAIARSVEALPESWYQKYVGAAVKPFLP